MMALLEDLFIGTLRMSAGAALCVAAVLIVRLFLKKAPRVFSYALWAVVLFRLLCPFVPETPWSPMPSAEIVPVPDEKYSYVQVSTGIQAVDGPVNDYLYRHPIPQREANVGRYPTGAPTVTFPTDGEAPLTWVSIGSLVWLAGLLAMLLWGAVSTLRLRRKLREAVKLEGERDIWLVDHIPTAFLWGGLFPKIYLPSDLPDHIQDYVVRHERLHASRGDHLIRMAAWLALVIHWFNPLVWLAFWLAGRDMEMSCDEMVLRQYDQDVRADYSEALLRQYTRPLSPVGPLAFGDSDPQSRIKNVLNYKKPAFWVIVIALIAVLAAGIALFTGRALTARGSGLPAPGPADEWVDLRAAETGPGYTAETQMREFPGVTFRLARGEDKDTVTAAAGGREQTLMEAWRVWAVYFCDLNEDGKRELCAEVTLSDEETLYRSTCVMVYDQADGALYTLKDGLRRAYTLQLREERLLVVRDPFNELRSRDEGVLFLVPGQNGRGAYLTRVAAGALPAAQLPVYTCSGERVEVTGLDADRVSWTDDGTPYGTLYVGCPRFLGGVLAGDGIEGMATILEDGVSFQMSVTGAVDGAAFGPSGSFTVDLSSGTVTEREFKRANNDHPDGASVEMSDREMSAAAQALAPIIQRAAGSYRDSPPADGGSAPAGLTYTYWPPIDAVEIGGLDCGQLTWYYPDDPAPEQVLLALQPRFLHPRLQGEDLAVSARWLDETGARLRVSFSHAGSGGTADPYTETPAFTADLAAGTAAGTALDHTFSGLPAFTEGELLDMARTLAGLIRGAEGFYAEQT